MEVKREPPRQEVRVRWTENTWGDNFMPILAGYMVPHPPLIVPAVGQGGEKQIEETTRAYKRVAAEIAALQPETILISSPHSLLYGDYFHVSPGKGAKGNFGAFRAPEVQFRETYDTELVEKICGIAPGERITLERFEVVRHE